jgi:DNA-binding beta-propeller fold protein YncE
MKFRMACLALLLAALGSIVLHAQQTPANSLLVLSKSGQTLAIVDPSSLKAIAKIPVGNDPHEVIASTDGKTAYVSNYGSGAYNTLAVIDLVAQKPLPARRGSPQKRRVAHSAFFLAGWGVSPRTSIELESTTLQSHIVGRKTLAHRLNAG